MAKAKTKQAIEQATDNQAVEPGDVAQELPVILDPTPIPPAPPLVFPELQRAKEPEPVDPFAYTDIKDIVRVPAGFTCAVKFNARDEYLTFMATADDVEAHGRAIYAACESGQWGNTPHYFPTDAELLEAAQERAARELRRANAEVTKYQDRVDVDDASPADVALLRAWKIYRVGLNRLPDQESFPHSLVWPVAPDTVTI